MVVRWGTVELAYSSTAFEHDPGTLKHALLGQQHQVQVQRGVSGDVGSLLGAQLRVESADGLWCQSHRGEDEESAVWGSQHTKWLSGGSQWRSNM